MLSLCFRAAQALGGCSDSGDAHPLLRGCSGFTWRVLRLYFRAAQTLGGFSPFTREILGPSGVTRPFLGAPSPLPSRFLLLLCDTETGTVTGRHKRSDKRPRTDVKRQQRARAAGQAPVGGTGGRWERPPPSTSIPCMSPPGTHVKAKATSAPLTTMKSRMFHRSRK